MNRLGCSRREHLRVATEILKGRDPDHLKQLIGEVIPHPSKLKRQRNLSKFKNTLVRMLKTLEKDLSKEEREILNIFEEELLSNSKEIYDLYDLRGRKIENFAFYILYSLFLNLSLEFFFVDLNLESSLFFNRCYELLEKHFPELYKVYDTNLDYKFFTLRHKKLKDLDIEARNLREIDPSFRLRNSNKIYKLLKPPKKTVQLRRRGRTHFKFMDMRRNFMNSIFLFSLLLFIEVSKLYFNKKAKGLFAACLYISAYYKLYEMVAQYLISGEIGIRVLRDIALFPKSKLDFAKFFKVDIKTFNKRLEELNEILNEKPLLWIEVVNKLQTEPPPNFLNYVLDKFK